jgi:hypothetical protein
MAMFHVYADDSGKFDSEKCDYTSLCGYVAHVSEWQRFGLEWNNCRMRWQVPPIHLRRINHPDEDTEWRKIRDDWGKDWNEKRDAMLAEFAHVIFNAQVVCVGAVVDAAHYRRLGDSSFKRTYKDSVSLAFHQLVMRGIEKTEIVDKCSPISLVVDDDRDSSLRCHEILNVLKSAFSKVRERISGICYVNDRAYPGVQAADMIAYESRKLMVERKNDPNVEPSELFHSLTLALIHQPKLYTADVLDRLHAGRSENEKQDRVSTEA